jgi:osmotically-inducible protein OsmY
VDDKSLGQDIINELDWEPGVDAANVSAAVNDGVVTLNGHVPSYVQVVAAEAAVKRVKGVRAVALNIEVRIAGAAAYSDEDVANHAVSQLIWSAMVPREAVQVKVHKGWITLTGEVEWQYQRRAAEENVRCLVGVRGVSNLITVKPHLPAWNLARSIEDALKREAGLEDQRITVSSDNDSVRLEGQVHSLCERDAVERVAWAAPGVRTVEDQMSIS